MQLSLLVPASALTLRHTVFIGIGGALGTVLYLLVLAQTWRFPIPFSFATAGPIWQTLMFVGITLAIGVKQLRAHPEIGKQIKAVVPLWFTQSLLIMVYPVYHAIFLRLSSLGQVAFVLLLPVIRYSMNSLVRRVTVGIPAASGIGMVSVKLFDALYAFKCMGSAGSLVSGAVLITLDLLQNSYHFWCLHKRVQNLNRDMPNSSGSVDHAVMVQSSMARLTARSHSTLHLQPFGASELPRNRVAPSPPSQAGALSPTPALLVSASPPLHGNVKLLQLDETLRLLLLDYERIVLVEFIECVVPMFYAVYLLVLFHLPNAKYYPEVAALDAPRLARTVGNIVAYATLELASLLYVHLFMRWKLQISALHMVANVLERDNAVLQSVFMTWVTTVLQLTLQHGGTWQLLPASFGPQSDALLGFSRTRLLAQIPLVLTFYSGTFRYNNELSRY